MPNKIQPLQESVVFTGKIGEVVHTIQPDGRIFERYRRSPGVRLIIVSPEGQILVTREHRQESDGVDLRLPGGKVCDTIESYRALLKSGRHIEDAAVDAAHIEAAEEAGYEVTNLDFVTKATAGATVEWDLYYFMTHSYTPIASGQQLGQGENIEVEWMSTDEIVEAIANGRMNEWRSVGVLLGIIVPAIRANSLTRMLDTLNQS